MCLSLIIFCKPFGSSKKEFVLFAASGQLWTNGEEKEPMKKADPSALTVVSFGVREFNSATLAEFPDLIIVTNKQRPRCFCLASLCSASSRDILLVLLASIGRAAENVAARKSRCLHRSGNPAPGLLCPTANGPYPNCTDMSLLHDWVK